MIIIVCQNENELNRINLLKPDQFSTGLGAVQIKGWFRAGILKVYNSSMDEIYNVPPGKIHVFPNTDVSVMWEDCNTQTEVVALSDYSTVSIGRGSKNDIMINHPMISRKHCILTNDNGILRIEDCGSSHGLYLNGQRIARAIMRQGDVLDLLHFRIVFQNGVLVVENHNLQTTLQHLSSADPDQMQASSILENGSNKSERFGPHREDNKPHSADDPDSKAIVFLEAGMEVFSRSDHKDEAAFKLIIASLLKAPLYFPVQIDLAAMFGNVDPAKLKIGDTVQPQRDVKMRILTMSLHDNTEFVPIFSSNEEMNKGQPVSIIRYYPQDYFPMLIRMGKPAIINPFSDSRFVLEQDLIKEVLQPLLSQRDEKIAPVSNLDQSSDIEPKKTDDLTEIKSNQSRSFFSKLFRKGGKADSHISVNKTVKRLYSGMNEQLRNKIFYGGLEAANDVLTTISNTVFYSMEDNTLELCMQIYVQTWIRSHGGLDVQFMMPSYIKQALCGRFSAVPPDKVEKCVEKSLEYIYRNEPELKEKISKIIK